jgi:Fur family ferric uptake transcriptional regulator
LIFEYLLGMGDRCDFRQWLLRLELRPTPARLAVLETLGAAPRALRAQEILEAIRAQRRVNKVTVYRILEDFTRRGIIRRLALEGRVSHYELACEHRPPHPHFQCRTCREIQCLEPAPLTRMWAELQGPLGNRADHIDVRVQGLCHKCREIS